MLKSKLRNEIINTAKDLLAKGRTESEITMNLIAKEIKITAPTLYHYFEGKDEIIQNAKESLRDDLLLIFKTTYPSSMNMDMRMKMLSLTLLDKLFENPYVVPFLFSGATTDKSFDLSEVRKQLAAFVSEWLKAEKIKVPAERTAYNFMAMLAATVQYLRNKKNSEVDLSKESEVFYKSFRKSVV
jgi:AcrR family transcriptional regulator